MSPDLAAATSRLDRRIADLVKSLEIQEMQARRTKRILRSAIAVLVLAVLGVIATGYTAIQARDAAASAHSAINATKHSQVVNCQNSNDSRHANLTLWLFLIDQSKADTPQEKVALQKLDTYITKLYAPHDCSQLDKKYPLPKPPDLGLN